MNAPAGRLHERAADQTVTAVLGPTNTGKTHYAVERMLARESGVMGFPLRLLAREIYDRIVALRGGSAVALITGEEKIVPPRARYYCCTVEAMPLGMNPDFLAVDEIQLCADADRGHVFTDRLLRARGRYETLFLGAGTMRGRIASLVPGARFVGRERFSTLSYAGAKKISRLKPKTAVVAFSTDQVYAIAELIRRQRGGAAVVMGALSPRTRNAQVALYAEGHVDYIVATDAIGMGLNLDIDHVAFAGTAKFDGHRRRALEAQEIAQIAGRAGRYTQDGSFGVTGEAGPLAAEVVEAVTEHRFGPVRQLMWRNSDLQFGTVPALIASLEAAPEHRDLVRAREAEDVATLRALWEEHDIRALAVGGPAVRRLWDVCQTPDFPKAGLGEHSRLVGRIYRFLSQGAGVIPSDWFQGQVRRLDRAEGDIDTISRRLAQIRTWTYVANRPDWVAGAEEWRETTRAVEDRLSDALHEGLTRRFVDRRTSVLMRRLKQKERLVAEVSKDGEVAVEGEFVGRLQGFRFRPDETEGAGEAKALRSASVAALQSEFARRADKLYLSPDGEIDLTEQGGLMWGTDAVGRLEKGDDVLSPKVVAFVDDMAEPAVAEKVSRRLTHWLARRTKALFEPMLAMREDETVTGLARGVAFQLSEAMGILPRRQIAEDVKSLGQEERALLRKHGVRFGQHSVFLPAMLKPAPTRLRLTLWSLWEGFEEFAVAPPPGHVTIPAIKGAPQGYYEKAGYRLCGARAIRIDMLERLADLIRPMDRQAGFEATPEMLSITGCTLEQIVDIFRALGFEAEKAERPRPARTMGEGKAAVVCDRPPPGSAAAEDVAVPTPGEIAALQTGGHAPAEHRDAAAADDSAPPAPGEIALPGDGGDEGPEPLETPTSPPAPEEAPPPAPDEAPVPQPGEAPPEAPEEAPQPQPDETPPTAPDELADGAGVPAGAEADAAAGPVEASSETEVYYIFRNRPRGARRPRRDAEAGQRPGGRRGPAKEGSGEGAKGRPRGKGPRGAEGKTGDGKPGGGRTRARGKGEGKGGPGDRAGDGKGGRKPQTFSAGPRREKQADPDSPFAILQKLKEKG